MATKNLVPRATGEGQIGTSAKKWSQANFVTGSFDNLNVGSSTINEAIDDRVNTLLTAGSNITLTYNDSANSLTIASTVSGGSTTLAGLSDTAISSPSGGHILVHDGTNSFDNVALSGDATLAANGTLTLSSSATPTFASLTLTQNAGLNMSNKKITSLATPTSNNDAANKSYVDNVAQGLVVKDSVVILKDNTGINSSNFSFNNGTNGVGATITRNSNGSINDSGELGATINLSLNDRVLISGWYRSHSGGNYSDGGIYFVSHAGDSSNPYVLTRALDADTPEKLKSCFVFVEKGTAADKGFVMNLDNVTTIGTSDITFAQFTAVPYNDFTEVSDDSTPELGGNLNTNGKYLYNSSNVEVRPSGHNSSVQGSGSLRIRSSDNVGPGKISLRGSGGNDSSSEYVTIQAPANSSMSGTSYTLTLPTDDGAYSRRFLYSNGSGVLSWVGITAFKNIAVSGQSNVVADTAGASLPNDTLTLVAGSGMTITTDAAAKSVTFASSGGGGSYSSSIKDNAATTGWYTPGTSGSSQTINDNGTNNEVYYILTPTANNAIVLPNPSTAGQKINIKKMSSSYTIVISAGSNKLDGSTSNTHSLSIQYENITFVADGSSNWYRV